MSAIAILPPLAHAGHWYHALLYMVPVLLISAALWWSGRGEGEEPEPEDEDELLDPGPPEGPPAA